MTAAASKALMHQGKASGSASAKSVRSRAMSLFPYVIGLLMNAGIIYSVAGSYCQTYGSSWCHKGRGAQEQCKGRCFWKATGPASGARKTGCIPARPFPAR